MTTLQIEIKSHDYRFLKPKLNINLNTFTKTMSVVGAGNKLRWWPQKKVETPNAKGTSHEIETFHCVNLKTQKYNQK